MNQPGFKVRRATVEDLAVLRGLWTTGRLPVFELEKRLTEFQLLLRPDDTLLGALGVRESGWHGLLHHPCFYSAAAEEQGLPVIWEHLQTMARQRGLARFWMPGPVAPFWENAGFRPATPVELNRLPAPFREIRTAKWWTLALRDDALLEQVVEKEFARIREEGRRDTERWRRQAVFWKWAGIGLAFALFLGALWLLSRVLGTVGTTGGTP